MHARLSPLDSSLSGCGQQRQRGLRRIGDHFDRVAGQQSRSVAADTVAADAGNVALWTIIVCCHYHQRTSSRFCSLHPPQPEFRAASERQTPAPLPLEDGRQVRRIL